MFLFLKPFSSKLWMVIAGTLLATGATVYYMEWGNQFDFEPELKEAPNGTRSRWSGSSSRPGSRACASRARTATTPIRGRAGG